MDQHGKHRPLVRAFCALSIWAAATPVAAQCRLALLLAMDISSSVDETEDALQRAGLAHALLSPEVQEALLEIPETPVALAVYEWSGRYQQDLVMDWRILDTPLAILNAAEAIGGSKRSYAEFPTAMGYGVGHAVTLFRSAPDCLFHVLDVSGDGVNNDGFGPQIAYENFDLADVTVNGLAIGGATENDRDVFDFYRRELIKGPGAFVETASDFDDFERAMRVKLLREVKAKVIGSAGAPPMGG